MANAKNQIIQSTIKGQHYQWGILEKQNDSGLLFNERIFFIRSEKQFGYISDTKTGLNKDNVQNPKALIHIEKIKNILIKDKEISIKYTIEEQNRKFEKAWLLRAATQALAKKWQDKLKYEKTRQILSRTPPKLLQQEQSYRRNVIKESSASRSKRLSVNHAVTFSANPKPERHSRQIGVEAREPSPPQTPVQPFRMTQHMEYGTGMSSRSQLQKSKSKSRLIQQANIGTSTADLMPKVDENYAPSQSQSRLSQLKKSALKPVKEEILAQTNKVEPFSYSNKVESNINKSDIRIYIAAQTPKQEPKELNKSKAQDNVSSIKIRESGLLRSNTSKLKNVQVQPQQDKNDYYNRTRHLIQQSSRSPPAKHIQPIRVQQPQKSTHNFIASNFNQSSSRPHPQDSQLSYLPPQIYYYHTSKPAPHSIEKNDSKQEINQYYSQMQEEETEERESAAAFAGFQEIYWTYKYLKYGYEIFEEFQEYTLGLLSQILKDIKAKQNRFQCKFVKNGVRYFQIGDLEVKIAIIQLVTQGKWVQRQKLCNKNGIRMLRNEYNNYQMLYECLDPESNLKVPLVCLNQVYGVLALFKTVSRGQLASIRPRQIESALISLKNVSKIVPNIPSTSFLRLDTSYYKRYTSDKSDKALFDNIIILQQLQYFLPPDLITDRESSQNALLRRQLVDVYAEKPIKYEQMGLSRAVRRVGDKNYKQMQIFGDNVLKAISIVIRQLQSLQFFFYTPSHLSSHLHSHGINLRYLGHIYEYLTVQFQKKMIMTEMASRCCKILYRKTIQDLIIQDGISQKEVLTKVCQFFNCVLGNTYQTAAMWKVISRHSKEFYGVQIKFQEIQKGYFIIAVVQMCRLEVVWDRIIPSQVFNTNFLFNQGNLISIKPHSKIYPCYFDPLYCTLTQILHSPQCPQSFQTLLSHFQTTSLPSSLSSFTSKLKKYLSHFISPQEHTCKHLSIYSNLLQEGPCQSRFQIGMIQIRWLLKNREKDRVRGKCQEFVRIVSKYYGEYHPVFSQLYDIFSTYYSQEQDYNQAITFAKSSLVNTLSLCGTHHPKTAQNYYLLALTYLYASNTEQALKIFQKTKKILQQANDTTTLTYSCVLVKMAKIYLNMNLNQKCVVYGEQGLENMRKMDVGMCQGEIVEGFQVVARGYQVGNQQRKLRELSGQVSQILQDIRSPQNIQKLLKIYLYPLLVDLPPQSASNYLDIISQLPLTSSDLPFLSHIQNRLIEGTFQSDLIQYLKRLNSIEQYIRAQNLLENWDYQQRKEEEQEKTVEDFVCLTEEILGVLGQGFVTGALRQAL